MRNQHIVYINLTDGEVRYEPISDEMRRNYLGGGGFNTKILYDSDAMYYDAMSEKNVLVFGAGCLVGTGVLAGNRCVISTKSPVTDMFGDSNIGGTFPVRMRQMGIDNLVFTGKAKSPVYVHFKADGTCEICPADDLWGKYTDETTDILMERHGKRSEVACIGTAGESLVRYANVMMSKTHAAGRMGTGCVMGSKNLKAIVIDQHPKKVEPADEEAFNAIKQKWLKGCKRAMTTALGKVYGTLFLMELNTRSKALPVRNAMTGEDPNSDLVMPDQFKVDHQVKKIACYGCPVGCSKKYETRVGRFKGEEGERIEFGAAVSMGPYVGIFKWDEIIHLKLLADKMGVDTIEVAAALGIILEGRQRGLLTLEQVGGRDVKFGDVDDVEYLMNLMHKREGIGDYIAEGSYREGIALNLSDYAFCINKACTALQPRGRLVRSLGYITSTRGGDHLKSFAFTMQNGGYSLARHLFGIKKAKKQLGTTENNGRILWWHENYKNVVDAIGVCLFAIQGLPAMNCALYDDFAAVMNALYGLDMTEEEVLKSSERIYQLQNAFNVNCGLNIDDYQWSHRKKDEDISDDYIKATTIECRDAPGMLPEYFKFRGLDSVGRPTVEKFQELGLDEFIEKAGCVHVDDLLVTEEILKQVKISVKYNIFDWAEVILHDKFMGTLLKKKSDSTMKKLKKKKKLEEEQANAEEAKSNG